MDILRFTHCGAPRLVSTTVSTPDDRLGSFDSGSAIGFTRPLEDRFDSLESDISQDLTGREEKPVEKQLKKSPDARQI